MKFSELNVLTKTNKNGRTVCFLFFFFFFFLVVAVALFSFFIFIISPCSCLGYGDGHDMFMTFVLIYFIKNGRPVMKTLSHMARGLRRAPSTHIDTQQQQRRLIIPWCCFFKFIIISHHRVAAAPKGIILSRHLLDPATRPATRLRDEMYTHGREMSYTVIIISTSSIRVDIGGQSKLIKNSAQTRESTCCPLKLLFFFCTGPRRLIL